MRDTEAPPPCVAHMNTSNSRSEMSLISLTRASFASSPRSRPVPDCWMSPSSNASSTTGREDILGILESALEVIRHDVPISSDDLDFRSLSSKRFSNRNVGEGRKQ
ncbi:unnamed protein product [Cylindrotheca closterium]|uniref:Uncharacterized protein n=1 Tax=Cylindrotheca closterium TaxID=2856 RepID=A0AAD2JL15_9STRA|nr:unnamed protein product [Cylindrotheca closterium]